MVLYLNGQDLNLTEKFLHFVHMRSVQTRWAGIGVLQKTPVSTNILKHGGWTHMWATLFRVIFVKEKFKTIYVFPSTFTENFFFSNSFVAFSHILKETTTLMNT